MAKIIQETISITVSRIFKDEEAESYLDNHELKYKGIPLVPDEVLASLETVVIELLGNSTALVVEVDRE